MSGYHHGRDHSGDLDLDCGVVVVGSGSSGAVIACHLAEAGFDVIVVEEGGHTTPDEIARMRPSQTMRHLWREAGMTMAVGVRGSPMINVMMGRCVGGSSVMTGGVCFRIPEAVLREWRDDHGLSEFTPEALEACYADVEKVGHIAEVPVDMQSRSTALFAEGAAKLGHTVQPMRRNTHDCHGWSTCNFGCPRGAKMSVDRTYLPRAVSAGAAVHSDCLVDRVTRDRGRATGIEGRVLNGPDGSPGGKLTIRASRVVLAAGAYHTPLILQRSGVGKRSRQVGRNLTLHPAFRVMARFDEDVSGWRGSMQSAFSGDFEDEGIQLNSMFTPGGILAATMPGIGDAHRQRAMSVKNLAMFGANLHDDPGGVVTRGLGREPFVRYGMSRRDKSRIPRALQICADIFFAAGAREVFIPVLGFDGLDADAFKQLDLSRIPTGRLECTSQHPLGTARMGVDESTSVVNREGRCWELEELYVADGAAVPTSLGVNPQLAIMTLATRTAWNLRDKPI